MKYRIVSRMYGGKKHYFIQERSFFFFWKDMWWYDQLLNRDVRKRFKDLESAKKELLSLTKEEYIPLTMD